LGNDIIYYNYSQIAQNNRHLVIQKGFETVFLFFAPHMHV